MKLKLRNKKKNQKYKTEIYLTAYTGGYSSSGLDNGSSPMKHRSSS